jgi:hypothetical protein
MARAWRPAYACTYVISDICGNADSLEVILNRIFPFRFSENQIDRCVFLGNYVDKFDYGCDVIELLIRVKQEYNNDKVIFLRGKHDELMLRALCGGDTDFNLWMDAGGRTTIAGYLRNAKSKASPYDINRNRLKDLVPNTHIEFLQHTDYYYIIDQYCLFNSGFNIKQSIKENNPNNFCFDTTSSKYIKDCIRNKIEPSFIDPYIFIGSNNYQGKEPFIHPKYMMLGGTDKIIVLELNSMEMSAISNGKSRIYKYNYDVVE